MGLCQLRPRREMDQAAFFLILLSGTINVCFSLRHYYFVNESKTWQEAQSYCRANYTDLATVASLVEVNRLLENVTTADPTYKGMLWIGLKRRWAWSTGDSLSYTSWYSAQPDDPNEIASCAYFTSSGWYDYYCSNTNYFYCFNASIASNDLILVTILKNWTDAQAYCKQHYTDLAFINSSVTYKEAGWIGLISSQWSDGDFSTYRYWTTGYAESSLINKCTAINLANYGTWISTECNLRMPFVCYGGPKPVNRQYYYMAYPRSWFFAQRFCRARFTDLATIDSFDDMNIVINQTAIGYNGPLWIGLNRSTQAQWGWSRGDERLSNYSNWDSGRPNGFGECTVNFNNVWRDYNCSAPLYFVCYYEEKGYIMIKSNKTWRDAQTYCRSKYTDLATIRSPREQKQLIQLVGRGVYVWIGLFLDTWKWSDQWSLFFRNWALEKPNATSGDCTAMMTNETGTWSAHNCSAALPVVCYLQGNMKRVKNMMKIKVSSNGIANLNDQLMQAMILKQIKECVEKNSEHSNNISVSWKLTSGGNVFVKQNTRDLL